MADNEADTTAVTEMAFGQPDSASRHPSLLDETEPSVLMDNTINDQSRMLLDDNDSKLENGGGDSLDASHGTADTLRGSRTRPTEVGPVAAAAEQELDPSGEDGLPEDSARAARDSRNSNGSPFKRPLPPLKSPDASTSTARKPGLAPARAPLAPGGARRPVGAGGPTGGPAAAGRIASATSSASSPTKSSASRPSVRASLAPSAARAAHAQATTASASARASGPAAAGRTASVSAASAAGRSLPAASTSSAARPRPSVTPAAPSRTGPSSATGTSAGAGRMGPSAAAAGRVARPTAAPVGSGSTMRSGLAGPSASRPPMGGVRPGSASSTSSVGATRIGPTASTSRTAVATHSRTSSGTMPTAIRRPLSSSTSRARPNGTVTKPGITKGTGPATTASTKINELESTILEKEMLIDSLRDQITTLEASIETIRSEQADKSTQVEQALQKTTEEFSHLQISHAEYKTKIAQLQAELEQASLAESSTHANIEQVEQLQSQAEENEATLANMKKELEETLAELKRTREEHHSSIAELISQHGAEKSHLESDLKNDYTAKLQQLQAEWEKAKVAASSVESGLPEEIAQLERTHQEALENLRDEHQKASQAVESELENNHKAEMMTLKEAHQKALAKLQEEDDALLQETKDRLISAQSTSSEIETRVNEEWKKAREELENSLQEVKSQLAQIVMERDTLQTKLADAEQSHKAYGELVQHEKEEVEKKHAAEMSALKPSHEEKYANLVADAKREADANHSAELARLREETAKAVEQLKAVHAVEIQSVHESGESIIASIKASLQDEITSLRNDLEAAKQDLSEANAREAELSRRLSDAQTNLSKNQESASSAQTALTHAQKALADQEEKLKMLSEDNSELLHSELDKSMAEVEELKLALNRTQEDMASELDWTKEQHKKEVESVRVEYAAREAALLKEMEQLARRPKGVGEELQNESDHDRKELQDTIDALNKEVADLRKQSETSRGTASDVVQPLREQVDMLKSQVEMLEQENEKKDEEMKELHFANTKKLSEVEAEHRREMALYQVNS